MTSPHLPMIERMTDDEYHDLTINYSFLESHFGRILVASTEKGLCFIGFVDDEKKALDELKAHFPLAHIQKTPLPLHTQALEFFEKDISAPLHLHLHGTDFQLKVWEALLSIPRGHLRTYGKIAEQIGKTKAIRAVGTAIGSNPISLIIPCHRVVPSSGGTGNYHW